MNKTVLLAAMILLIASCAPAAPSSSMMAQQSSQAASSAIERACFPYGIATARPAYPNPVFTTTLAEATRVPLPTCTPDPRPTRTPLVTAAPTLTPWRVEVYRSAIASGMAAPQNLSLTNLNTGVDRVAVGKSAKAVTWNTKWGQMPNTLSLFGPWGDRTFPAVDALGAGGPTAVAVSEAGRIHLYAGGRYAYSDDQGSHWNVSSAPEGGSPTLAIDPSGYARLFLVSGDTLASSLQQRDGTWSAPEPMFSGVRSYDAVRTAEGVVVAATDETQVRVFVFSAGQRDSSAVAAFAHKASSVSLTHRNKNTVLGMNDTAGPGQALLALSTDGGRSWSSACLVQETASAVIGDVAGFWTDQGVYVALWVWRGGGNNFPYIAISTVRWVGDVCAPYPEPNAADALAAQQSGPPGLFYMNAPQRSFRLAVDDDGRGLIAFEGIQLSGGKMGRGGLISNVYAAEFEADGILGRESLR